MSRMSRMRESRRMPENARVFDYAWRMRLSSALPRVRGHFGNMCARIEAQGHSRGIVLKWGG